MGDKIQNFLRGRYGTDSLSKFLLFVALAGMFLPVFIKKAFLLYYLGVVLLIYSYNAQVFPVSGLRPGYQGTEGQGEYRDHLS